ncbi:hypothetical protein PVAND_016995 [Polypedilum vanderplanki]|uniref:THAP-type domain-containing protein n=1 Tax=Polypedilum vanderplanki TaxID=319348 RepID=A0A9J6BHB1_POLVA|nr:hypothetical protein PVAND_016995 [Polypedilum vanderplanki]
MVKRCCAKSCYNSQFTHKIGYFGFPKNEVIAREWARLAGRDDLAEKKLLNLTKYYLCSDHFTSKDFANPNVEDKSFLVLNRTPNFVPLPSQFENNLQKNVEVVMKNADKFVNYTKKEGTSMTNENKKLKLGKRKFDEINFEVSNIEAETNEQIMTEIEYIEEVENICRLCAKPEFELVQIFNENGELTPETECIKIMPSSVIQFNDGLPQHACIGCLEKLQQCVDIVDGFVLNQDLFLR